MAETLGSLIDKLSIVNLKIWRHEDVKRRKDVTNDAIARSTRATNVLNQQRNDLIEEIDRMFAGALAKGEAPFKDYQPGSTKSYG